MDLLDDDDDDVGVSQRTEDKAPQLQQGAGAPRVQSHIFDLSQISRPAPQTDSIIRTPISRPPPQTLVAPPVAHSIHQQQAFVPPQQQQSSVPVLATKPVVATPSHQPGAIVDVMAMLIRATMPNAAPEEKMLMDHIRSCTHGRGCPFPNCEAAKDKYRHYTSCTLNRCIQCAPARLIYCRTRGKVNEELERRFRRSRAELQQHIKLLRVYTDSLAEAKRSGNPVKIAEEEVQLGTEKKLYDSVKESYEDACEAVAVMWIELRQQRQAQAQQAHNIATAAALAVPSTMRPAGVVPSRPPQHSLNLSVAANAPATGGVAVPPPSTAKPPVQQAPPAQPVIKRSEEILDGHAMEFVFGDAPSAALAELDSALEATTAVSAARDDDWVSRRGISDQIELDWVEHNVLTKAEIETEQHIALRGSKRLFSNREIEYLSRAAQEMVTDVLAECVRMAKHRRLTTGDLLPSESLAIDFRDLEAVLLRPAFKRLGEGFGTL